MSEAFDLGFEYYFDHDDPDHLETADDLFWAQVDAMTEGDDYARMAGEDPYCDEPVEYSLVSRGLPASAFTAKHHPAGSQRRNRALQADRDFDGLYRSQRDEEAAAERFLESMREVFPHAVGKAR